MAGTGRSSISEASRKSSRHLEVPVTLSLLLVTLALFAAPIAANNCPSFRPIGVECPPATSAVSASASDAANPACKSQAYLGRFAVQGSKRFRLPALPNGVPLPPGALSADCCAECQQRADCAYWNILLRSRRCLLFAADVCAADGPAVFLPGEENAFVGTRYCNATPSVTRTPANTTDTTQDDSTPSESALSIFEDATDEDEQETAEGQAEERAEAEEEHDAHVMGVFEGDMARMHAEEAEELKIVEAASQAQEQQQAEGAYQNIPEAMAALELEVMQSEEQNQPQQQQPQEQQPQEQNEQQEQPHGVEVFELFELQQENPAPFQENSQVMQQIEREGVAAQQAGEVSAIQGMEAFEEKDEGGEEGEKEEEREKEEAARAAAVKEMEEEEIPIRLVSFSLVDPSSQITSQAAAMEAEEAERKSNDKAKRGTDAEQAAWRDLEQQEIPVKLTSYEIVDADSLAASQAAAMEEEVERQADASATALRDLEEQEIPVKLTSYEMVDAGSLADRQAEAMEKEEAERQERERAAVLRQLEEQEIPVRLNLRGHSAFHTAS
ncbi:unnamed protein product [Closterium sp. NIES-64]|nr:unnamed protein product [Closterium sp. NIES-64]CAI5957121.1 unnamed protein product [Closterium sp. NIES-65]CAI5957128.1 unnamed protein product [Closterium sp. NIES-65]CAI5997556.1 unnamed protein product [Closterium sp. NIES-64]CAI5998430.1 unnamed protein product [Closterium sp. NIES-65]